MLTVAAVIVVGVALGPASGLTAGAMVGFIFLTYRFLEPIAEFTEVLDQTQTAVAGLRRVLGVLDMPGRPAADRRDPRPLPPGPLDIDVARGRRSPTRRGASPPRSTRPCCATSTLHIPAGQQVAWSAPPARARRRSGGSIARFADPTIGQIRLGGVPLHDVANDELRRRLVVVSQEPFLFDDTIAANIGFARPGHVARRDGRRSSTGSTSATGWTALPDGLMTPVGERGEQLSAGERQLVALLRAGVADPDVLVLDEATSSVDALTEVRISRALDAPRRGPHDDRHRPPAVDGGPRRPGARARRRPARRGRPPRRAGRGRRHLRPAVRRLDAGDRRPAARPLSGRSLLEDRSGRGRTAPGR